MRKSIQKNNLSFLPAVILVSVIIGAFLTVFSLKANAAPSTSHIQSYGRLEHLAMTGNSNDDMVFEAKDFMYLESKIATYEDIIGE